MKRKYSQILNSNDSNNKNEYNVKSNQNAIINQLKEISFYLYQELMREKSSLKKDAQSLILKSSPKISDCFSKDFSELVRHERLKLFENHSNQLYKIISHLPGFLNLSKQDQALIMSENFFTILTVKNLEFFIDGDFYLMLNDNIRLDRNLFALLYNDTIRDYFFHYLSSLKSLELTEKELALLIPFFLSSTSEYLWHFTKNFC
ncbi:unnamed protein product [Brachionus calyciflorus]|uniref:Uncharacterized protein n=1 Tax=Brachionus calyciflorus TaxID=104777 RepID=A0A813SEM9_9BILA|nr:unnamed protein product [Brachionus calyciflorus]